MHLSLETLRSIARLICSGESDRPSELRYNFSISNNLTLMVTFPTIVLDCDSCSFGFIYFFSPKICSTEILPPLANSDYVFVSLSLNLPSNVKGEVPFDRTDHDYPHVEWYGPSDLLRDAPWDYIWRPSSSAATTEFCQ